jgi:hypothetical protein
MEKITRQYFCDVCHENITGQAYRTSVTLNLTVNVGTAIKSRAWSELCSNCYDKIEEQVGKIIIDFPVNNKL